jgi:diguanylate cyclase (GGDEF)-like protein/PAS domain S-box-containing protein
MDGIRIFEDLFESLPDAVTLSVALRDEMGHAVDMRLLRMNRTARAGQPDPDASIGQLCSELWPQMVVNGSFAACMRVLDTGVSESGEFWWTESQTFRSAGYDYKAERVGTELLLWVLRDNTDLVQRMMHDEARFQAAFDEAPVGMAMITGSGQILLANNSLRSMVGNEHTHMPGTSLTSWVDNEDRRLITDALATVIGAADVVRDVEVRLRSAGPDTVWAHMSIAGLTVGDDTAGCYIVHLLDVSVQKSLEFALTRQALHDPLTDLANRALLTDRLESALSRLSRHGTAVGVIFVDVDNFKVINDGLGHLVGDAVLTEAARRLQRVTRVGDTVARFGGDEFVVICEDLENEAEAYALAVRVNDAFRRPLLVGDRSLSLTVSVGVASTTDDGTRAHELIRDADIAMYRAKAEGRDRCVIFDDALRDSALRRLELETELRRAIDSYQLVLDYQPIVSLTTGDISGVEALVRWRHPERGTIAPHEFIPLAEDTGLIVALGEWVLADACLQGHRWHGLHPDLTISVNLSAHQVHHPDLMGVVRAALNVSGMDPRLLSLELTESVLMRDPDVAAMTLHGLKRLGVGLSLDDFGTGYSSLAYLHQFPIDVIKIDRSFVAGLGSSPQDSVVCTAIVGLADALGLSTIAEGVETQHQLQRLTQLGCTAAQGYYLARPQSAAAIDEMLARSRHISHALVAH